MNVPASPSSSNNNQLPQLEFSAVKAGGIAFLPIGLFVAVFGAAFGVAAAQNGLSQMASVLMSATVFAGAAQFGALELWGDQVNIAALIATVFAINARHILMGAVVYPHLQHLKSWEMYLMMLFATDSNWAISVQEFSQKKPVKAMGTLLGGGICLWIFWVLGTWLGFYFGNAVSQPQIYGLDMVMACFLLSIALVSEQGDNNDGWKDKKTLTIWLVAAVSSIVAYLYLPENTNVIFAAVIGGLVGVFMEGNSLDKNQEIDNNSSQKTKGERHGD